MNQYKPNKYHDGLPWHIDYPGEIQEWKFSVKIFPLLYLCIFNVFHVIHFIWLDLKPYQNEPADIAYLWASSFIEIQMKFKTV